MSWNGVFMAEIQNHECLYNKFSREYRNKELRDQCWQTVAEKFNMTPMAAEKKFRNIRTAYGRWLRKRRTNPSKNGPDFIPFAFENCEWLAMHIIHRESTLNNETTCTKPDESGSDDDGSPVTMSNMEFLNFGDYNDISPSRYSNNNTDNSRSTTSQNVETAEPSEHIEGETRHLDEATVAVNLPKQAQRETRDREIYQHDKGNTIPTTAITTPSASQTSISTRQVSSNEQITNDYTRPQQNFKRKYTELEDEDDLYCRSLVPRLKRLTPQGKAYVRIQLEQLLYHAEYSGMIPNIATPFGCHATQNTQTTSFLNGRSDPPGNLALTRD